MHRLKISIVYLLSALLLILSGCTADGTGHIKSNVVKNAADQNQLKVKQQNINRIATANTAGKLRVDYINVGQGDSILISQGQHNMLIDAGNNEDGSLVTNYIRSQGIKRLEYIIGTHPHEDHIGGMDVVIKNFQVKKIYMPKVTINTRTFEDVLTAIRNKGLKVNAPVPGSSFKLGAANVNVLGPLGARSSDLNTYSIVTKISFGSNSFLFTGDAQISNEEAMIRKGYDLKADVLKVGHHGSNTSTGKEFLNKVQPKYAVISCGMGNIYGHPHQETVDELRRRHIKLYRTDEQRTIIATSNGNTITFNRKPGSYNYGKYADNSSTRVSTGSKAEIRKDTNTKIKNNRIVYWTVSGRSYHYDKNCPTLRRSKKIISGVLSKSPKKDPCDLCVK
ncbi:ComEC/Rec2 family competence protein [Clostridium oryzae]|uniref:Hydroxyacylglutathione hydrolase n=1 Tax=Clostridium oryzae TaxID=1450648 RepID=A0A1V4IHV1_9CLOT|nr:ComEC/Rec2 family competence protein [Clostridium oryzae]OPJ59499.1 hydroxyacylglutathione hydrolase [Clostridium oryzae]